MVKSTNPLSLSLQNFCRQSGMLQIPGIRFHDFRLAIPHSRLSEKAK